jgi:type VI secretion system protein ImpG
VNRELLPYYERELHFVRKMATEFAAEYPDRAAALGVEAHGCDPHVERIIEAFALIAGRIQHRLDQEFPEITSALLELLYPHLLRPVPSLVMVQFAVDPEVGNQPGGHFVASGSIVSSRAIENVRCQFRTAYATRLWPLRVNSAAFGNSSDIARGVGDGSCRHAVRIEIEALGGTKLSKLNLSELRFRIGGDAQVAHWMHEVLLTRVKKIVARALDRDGRPAKDAGSTLALPTEVRAVGYSREEALLPPSDTSFQGYRLLQEYFTYPQKFLFLDVVGFDRIPIEFLGNRFEILLLIDDLNMPDRVAQLEMTTGRDTFQLGCTPAINLFSHKAEPIRLAHTRTEYEVQPDVYSPTAYEVYSVDRMLSVTPNMVAPKEYRPFYSFGHNGPEGAEKRPDAFWYAIRRASRRIGDAGTDYFVSFVDRDFKFCRPAHEAMTAKLTCSNRNLPLAINPNGTWGEMDLESGPLIRTRLLHAPTPPRRPKLLGGLQWRLISHLSLNHLSIVEGGANALREILRLYDQSDTHSSAGQIAGITALRSTPKIMRLESEKGFVFCSGLGIDLEMDEDRFAGGSAYLLASVLERFFGLYCAVNSFTQLRVSTRQRRETVWQWPIRSGEQAVV